MLRQPQLPEVGQSGHGRGGLGAVVGDDRHSAVVAGELVGAQAPQGRSLQVQKRIRGEAWQGTETFRYSLLGKLYFWLLLT